MPTAPVYLRRLLAHAFQCRCKENLSVTNLPARPLAHRCRFAGVAAALEVGVGLATRCNWRLSAVHCAPAVRHRPRSAWLSGSSTVGAAFTGLHGVTAHICPLSLPGLYVRRQPHVMPAS